MTDLPRSRDTPKMASTTLPSRAFAVSGPVVMPAAAAGDLGEVYEAHFKYVWRCLRSLGVADATIDDAVQEVFLVVQRKLPAFDGGAELRTWLYAIVLRVARRHRAEAARDAQRFQSHEAAGGERSTDAGESANADLRREVEQNERLALAQRALAALDDVKREVFVLACVEGMSAPEIAALTSVPLNTVYSRLRAARLAFAEAVATLSTPNASEGTPA